MNNGRTNVAIVRWKKINNGFSLIQDPIEKVVGATPLQPAHGGFIHLDEEERRCYGFVSSVQTSIKGVHDPVVLQERHDRVCKKKQSLVFGHMDR